MEGRTMTAQGKAMTLGANLSVKNEEQRILRQHLENLRQFCDEIVVTVDEASSDHSLEICREYTDKVFPIRTGVYADNIRREGSARLTTDWELWVDADQLFPPALQQEIRQAMTTGKHPVYHLPMVNMFFGHWYLRKEHWNYQLRLFRRKDFAFSRDDLHNWRFSYEGQAGFMRYPMLHYGIASVSEFLGILNRYTDLDLEALKRKGSGGLLDQSLPTPGLKALVNDPLERFDHIFNTLAYKEEREFGALYSWLFSFYTFVEKAKLLEAEHKERNAWEYGHIDMDALCRRIDRELEGEDRRREQRHSARRAYALKRWVRGLTPPYVAALIRKMSRG
ncbi:MAG TPA: glycosyltransferase family 2 protein [Bacteroidales bacterium]|nr:glycosyltransferase family 2 protein [Bacteroidales bacterium]